MKQTVAVLSKATVPSTPNFIRIGPSYQKLCALSEDELREVGKLWTEELIVKAKRQSEEEK